MLRKVIVRFLNYDNLFIFTYKQQQQQRQMLIINIRHQQAPWIKHFDLIALKLAQTHQQQQKNSHIIG